MSYTVIYPKARTTQELGQTVLTEDGFIWQPNGKEEVWYEVSVLPAAVEDMARKAARNQRQVSRAGPLRVRVLERTRIT